MCAPTTPVIYDTVDLHWLREGRREAMMAGSDSVALGPREHRATASRIVFATILFFGHRQKGMALEEVSQ